MSTMTATRFSNSFSAPRLNGADGLLVKVYPVATIEQPLLLTTEPVLIGRDSQCSLSLPVDAVSRRHATIEFDGTHHVIVDLGSLNGTFVNETRLLSPRPLETGDRIRFGDQIYKYLAHDDLEGRYHEVIFQMMTNDGLTGVANRRYFLDTLARELAQSQRSPAPLAVMLLDLDRFKSVNDTYGHLAGDAVLCEFARRATASLRSGDLLARYGGEEFCLLLTRTPFDAATTVAERLRSTIAASPITFEDCEIPVTVSGGLLVVETPVTLQPAELLAEADALLYSAKQAGRNQIRSSHRILSP
jgi:diguanylate cyclase (GGDEF)-like protein